MAIGDSLEKLIAARRAAQPDPSRTAWLAEREALFAPIVRRLRAMIGGIDARFIKSRLTKERAVIRVGNGEIDAGWDITPNSARNIDMEAPFIKVVETRNFMSDQQAVETLYFHDEDALIDQLERRITERTSRYRRLA
jgi:hypothetical protein